MGLLVGMHSKAIEVVIPDIERAINDSDVAAVRDIIHAHAPE